MSTPQTVTLAGATFRKASLRSLYETSQSQAFTVVVEPEPENEYDANAIAVHHPRSHDLLGYIPRKDQPSFPCHHGKEEAVCYVEYWREKDLYLAKVSKPTPDPGP